MLVMLDVVEGERGNMEITVDQRTISAREGLLDAVEALRPHGEAVILVGAQAVYMRVCLISLADIRGVECR